MENAAHTITLRERSRLEITGVEEVESFDDATIIMSTNQGGLTVRGEGLHIETLSLEGGALKVEGKVESLSYEDRADSRESLWHRLFR